MITAIAKLGAQNDVFVKVPEGYCVADLKKRLDPKWRKNVIVIVNGKIAQNEQVLTESDRIRIFPIMAGG